MAWADFGNLLTVDVAYYQGDYWGDGNVFGVIANVARGNQGSYQETTFGAKQVANARSQGKAVGFYFFNGNLNAYTCGKLFAATCIRLGFNPATDIIAIDCEDEGATGTAAWGPAQCANFVNGFASVYGSSVTWRNVLIYMNYSVNRRFDWSGPAAWGARLWYARPGHSVDQLYWSQVTMKQDGLYNGVDEDGHNQTYVEIVGGHVAAPQGLGDNEMYVRGGQVNPSSPTGQPYVYCVWTSDDGKPQIRLCGVNEAAFALAIPNFVAFGDDATLTGIGQEANFNGKLPGVTIDDAAATLIASKVTSASAEDIANATAAKVVDAVKIPTKFTINGEADANV